MDRESSRVTWKQAAIWVLIASYLPVLIASGFGAGHCDVCCNAWLLVGGIAQACAITFHVRDVFHLQIPQPDEAWMWVFNMILQLAWLGGWTWLAHLGKRARLIVTVLVFAVSSGVAWVLFAAIRS